MLSFTQEDREALHQAGITAELHPAQPQLMSLDEVQQNKFALLNDYPQMGFYFIRFPDELIPMQQQGQHFQCFGKCCYGYFALNDKGNVYLLSTNNDYTNASVVWVNHSLDEFIKSYSLLLAGVFQLKGSDTSTQEKLFVVLDKVAQQVTKAICEVHPKLLEEESLWEQFIYMIEDGWFNTAYHEIFYIREGRRSYN
ncbi:hypothetical protein [Capnocytophaga gingivalis]